MSVENPFLIGDEQDVSPQINGLIGMLRYTRKTTLDTVDGLGVDDLDHLNDPDSNTIAGLLELTRFGGRVNTEVLILSHSQGRGKLPPRSGGVERGLTRRPRGVARS